MDEKVESKLHWMDAFHRYESIDTNRWFMNFIFAPVHPWKGNKCAINQQAKNLVAYCQNLLVMKPSVESCCRCCRCWRHCRYPIAGWKMITKQEMQQLCFVRGFQLKQCHLYDLLANNKSWIIKKKQTFENWNRAESGFIQPAGMTGPGRWFLQTAGNGKKIGHWFALLAGSSVTLLKNFLTTFNYGNQAPLRAFSQLLGALCRLPFDATLNLNDVVSVKTLCFPAFHPAWPCFVHNVSQCVTRFTHLHARTTTQIQFQSQRAPV